MLVEIERNVLNELGKFQNNIKEFQTQSKQRIAVIESLPGETEDIGVSQDLRKKAVDFDIRLDRLTARIHEILGLAHNLNSDSKVFLEDINKWEKSFQFFYQTEGNKQS